MASSTTVPNLREQTVVVRTYQEGDAAAFQSLNEKWILQDFGNLEPEDLLTLRNPETYVLARGGQVFMATQGTRTVGCCALLAAGDGVYELAKMTVVDNCRGQGVGRQLLNFAVDAARSMGARSIFLGSNTKLIPALRLYESFGFRHVPPEQLPPSPYQRANVHMRLQLSD